jgi:hypothetical protein
MNPNIAKRTILAALCTNAIGLLAVPMAQAQTTPTRFKDINGIIYERGYPANTPISVEISGTPVTRIVYADACGIAKVSLKDLEQVPSDLKINGTAITSPPASTRSYRCNKGTITYGGTGNTPTSNFQTKNQNWEIALFLLPTSTNGPNKANTITYTANSRRWIKTDSCGVVTVKGNSRNPFLATTQITFGVNFPITFGNLPTAEAPLCKDGSTYTANAATPTQNGASLFRTATTIYQVGLPKNTVATVQLTALTSKRFGQYETNGGRCGAFTIRNIQPTDGAVTIEGNSFVLANAPTAPDIVDCTAPGWSNSFTTGTLYKDSFTPSEYLYVSPNKTSLDVQYRAAVNKRVSVNSCGFVVIGSPNGSTGFAATDMVTIDGTQTALSAIPMTTKPPICRGGTLYQAP